MSEFRSFATILANPDPPAPPPQPVAAAAPVAPAVPPAAAPPVSPPVAQTPVAAAPLPAPAPASPAPVPGSPPQLRIAPPVAAAPSGRIEPPTPPPIGPREVDAPPAQGTNPQLAAVLANFASEIVRLRARAAELVESEAESMLQMMASRVLVRELELAPADVGALVRQVRDEWKGSHSLIFRVAEADRERLVPLGERLESDPALQPGDLQVELPEGILDLRLGTRLAAVLDAHRIAV